MQIKKAFVGIIDHLRNNRDALVSDVLEAVEAMAVSNKGGAGGTRSNSNVILNTDGTAAAVFCHYHQMWEIVADVEYGVKASSNTGLNNMCKEGNARMARQNAEAKRATMEIVNNITAGTLAVEDVPQVQADIEAARGAIIPRTDGHGFDARFDVEEELGMFHDESTETMEGVGV